MVMKFYLLFTAIESFFLFVCPPAWKKEKVSKLTNNYEVNILIVPRFTCSLNDLERLVFYM